MRGELAQSDTIVLQTPLAGGVMACAQSVMFHAQQNMCSDVFWANNNQCACLRPGAICKEERSESGFGLYRLTRLGKKHGQNHCVKFDTEEQCSKKTHCEWKNEACAHKIKLSKEHVLGAYPQPGMTPQLGAYPQTGVAPGMSPQLGVGAYGRPGAPLTTGAYGAAGQMGNMQTALVPWRQGMDCEREIDEVTGLNSVIDLAPAATVHQCYQAVQMNPQCNPQQFVYQTRMDGFPGECNCVRVNTFCDEENKPSNGVGSWDLYDFTKGPSAMGGVAPMSPYPQQHGMPPAGGAYAGARPGQVGTHPGATQAAMQPGMQPQPAMPLHPATQAAMPLHPATQAAMPLHPVTQAAMPGAYPPAQPGMQAGMVQAGMTQPQAGMYPQTGAYGTTGAYGAMGAYPATGMYGATGAYGATAAYPGAAGAYGARPAAGYPAAGAYGAQPGMGYGAGVRPMLQKTHKPAEKSSDKSFKLVIMYAVVPTTFILFAAAMIGFYCKQKQRTNFNQHILMDDNTPSV